MAPYPCFYDVESNIEVGLYWFVGRVGDFYLYRQVWCVLVFSWRDCLEVFIYRDDFESSCVYCRGGGEVYLTVYVDVFNSVKEVKFQ